MPVMSVKATKRGPRDLLEVDFKGEGMPVLPPVCPCCLDPVEPDAFLQVNCGLEMLRFPACKICARHVPFFDKLSSLVGYLSLALGVVTTFAALVVFLGVVQGLSWPFRSTIKGLSTLLAMGALTVVYCFVIYGLTWPLWFFLAKRKCEDTPVIAVRLPKETTPHSFRFTFENVRYGRLFAEANGASAPAR